MPPFSTTPTAQRRRRRTRSATPLQQRAVAALAVIAAVAAAFAPPDPTGVGWLDVLYRMGFAVVLTFAASRARRWALIVASVAVSSGSLGPTLFAGVVAVGLALFLVGRDRRDRVYGAAIGVIVATASMHLSVDWFLGASAVLASVAAVVLILSGYRNTGSQVKRWWRLAAFVTAGIGALGVVVAGVAAAMSASALLDGVQATRAGVTALQNADRVGASNAMAQASGLLGLAADRTSAWWVQLGRAVPVVSQNLAVVQAVATSGEELTVSASDIAARVDYERLRLPEGGIDLGALATFRDPLVAAAAALENANTVVDHLDSPWQFAPLNERLDEFGRKVDELHRQTAIAALAVDRAPAMLGVNGERRYLVLLGNPAEARDLGGHLGNWAELDAVGGRLVLAAVGVPRDLASVTDAAALATLEGYPPSLNEMKPLTFPQNWGSSPDMAEVARLSADLYERKTQRHIDGVFYADPVAFANFLAITGPVRMTALGRDLSQADAAQFLTSTQFVALGEGQAANDAVTQLVRDVFDRLTKVQLPGPKALAELFRPAVLQGRFKFYSLVSADQPLLAALGIDGVLPIPVEGDVLGVINRNANPSKIDTYLHRSTTVDVVWDPETGEVSEVVTVTLRNDAPGTGLPPAVIGNDAGLPPGTNVTDLALLTGYELSEVTLDEQPVVSRPVYDGRYWRHTVRIALAPGQTRVARYTLEGGRVPSDAYSVLVVGQPLVNEGDLTLTVRPSAGTPIRGKRLVVRGRAAEVRLSDGASTAVELRLRR